MLQYRNAIHHAEGVIRAHNPSECELGKLMGALKSLVGVKEAIRAGGIDALLTSIARSIKETRVYGMRLPQEEMEITSKWFRVVEEASFFSLWICWSMSAGLKLPTNLPRPACPRRFSPWSLDALLSRTT
eukprot:8954401-Pyramimonas_sp.AAC.1